MKKAEIRPKMKETVAVQRRVGQKGTDTSEAKAEKYISMTTMACTPSSIAQPTVLKSTFYASL